MDRAMAVPVLRYAAMDRATLDRAGESDADGSCARCRWSSTPAPSRPWTAPGAAPAVAVTAGGEMLIPVPHVYLLLLAL